MNLHPLFAAILTGHFSEPVGPLARTLATEIQNGAAPGLLTNQTIRELLEAEAAVVRCCDCDQPATHFTEPMADYDPCCDAHFAEHFATCGHCGEVVPAGDTGTCEDGEDACTQCCRGWHEDEDAAYDRA